MNTPEPTAALVAADTPNVPKNPITRIQQRREAKQRLFEPQRLTNEKFMSRSQREVHRQGEEIWV